MLFLRNWVYLLADAAADAVGAAGAVGLYSTATWTEKHAPRSRSSSRSTTRRTTCAELHRQLTAALDATGRSFELILVDDGSTDGTREALLALEARDPRVQVGPALRRNFGQTAAFSAGFDRSRGDVVVTSDGDLQNDPADIPALVARLEADDLDMVCGWRRSRKDPLSKRIPSFFANRLISWATGVRLHDYGCSLKAMRGRDRARPAPLRRDAPVHPGGRVVDAA